MINIHACYNFSFHKNYYFHNTVLKRLFDIVLLSLKIFLSQGLNAIDSVLVLRPFACPEKNSNPYNDRRHRETDYVDNHILEIPPIFKPQLVMAIQIKENVA